MTAYLPYRTVESSNGDCDDTQVKTLDGRTFATIEREVYTTDTFRTIYISQYTIYTPFLCLLSFDPPGRYRVPGLCVSDSEARQSRPGHAYHHEALVLDSLRGIGSIRWFDNIRDGCLIVKHDGWGSNVEVQA